MSRRVLLDHNIPRPLRAHLTGCLVRTAEEEGWANLVNGRLLTAADQAGFDVMVTGDNNLRFQNNLSGLRMAIVVLSTPAWTVLRYHVEEVREAVNRIPEGGCEDLKLPRPQRRRRPFTPSP